MENLLFKIDYNNFNETFIKLIFLLFLCGLIIYVLFFILSKILLRKSNYRKELALRIAFLWALLIFFMLFNVYLFVLFYMNGINKLNFINTKFYLGLLPQMLIYLSIITFFLLKRFKLISIISKSSLN